jgi:hypothetical protein
MNREILFRGKRKDNGEWDKAHNYTKERNCGYCKHAQNISANPYATKLKCLEKEKDGAVAGVKSNYCCDLWENRYADSSKSENGGDKEVRP